MLYYGFIMPDGSEYSNTPKKQLHMEIAIQIIKERYINDFLESEIMNPIDFLVIEVGAIKVGNRFKSSSITVRYLLENSLIRNFVELYESQGYRVDYVGFHF